MTEDRVRVLRVLEYEGPREWIEATLNTRAVKGTRDIGNGCSIREALVGDFPQVVEEPKEESLPVMLSVIELNLMGRLGWEFSEDSSPAVKIEVPSGKIIAHEGSEVWTRDLKVVRDQA